MDCGRKRVSVAREDWRGGGRTVVPANPRKSCCSVVSFAALIRFELAPACRRWGVSWESSWARSESFHRSAP
jgi:hypothetical protein